MGSKADLTTDIEIASDGRAEMDDERQVASLESS
jgi:hypothetical protein